jgi:hypothetical protein
LKLKFAGGYVFSENYYVFGAITYILGSGSFLDD